ncbi:MAG: SDR family oxidoreductase [Bacillota bacterium]
MKILVCGAKGFIGRHLCAALAAAGHEVVRGVRGATAPDEVAIDYARDLRPDAWLPRLKGIDAVVNAVGILGESGDARFEAIHCDAPAALFQACAQAGVARVLQISALGGMEGRASTPYMRTKREADALLMASPLDWTILRPSLVVGVDGESSRLFRTLASLPLIGLPGAGGQLLQPVHIDDLCQAAVHILASDRYARRIVDAVGPRPMTYRAMLAAYREAMKLRASVWLPIPLGVVRLAARWAAKLPQRVLTPDTLRMLDEGNVGDPEPLREILGRPPLEPARWFAAIPAEQLRWQAIAGWMLPLFRATLAVVWIVTGLLSLGLYPVADSLAMLGRVGLHGTAAQVALYGAALLDCAFGIATLAIPRRALWRLQIALILGYTAVITLFLPQYWLHPFGPVLKNLPILALLAVLDASETR